MMWTVCTLVDSVYTVLIHEVLQLLRNEALSYLRHKRDVRDRAVVGEYVDVRASLLLYWCYNSVLR